MMTELSPNDERIAMLLASGFSREEVNQWFSHLKSKLDSEARQQELYCDEVLSARESLSACWIISRLKAISEGSDKQAAVAALSTLVDISSSFRLFRLNDAPKRLLDPNLLKVKYDKG
ncbi:TPA: hypothetical protein ACPZND_001846 [Yersinia enterocolitica]|uniref:hypothetical protein n=1 Tax=Yersinia intermedia TaxID=631 RepID=UPI001CFF1C24|nr:hypothetical protein [Yersinia intermedia]EKN6167161.1 hypothetical protein [Yersinia enterocolitica]EKN6397051.1 hypothetical protein [Yersinia enterocolitica]EKN6409960.1 hypothetical protein [Yersinia enterocolitica]ELY5221748.1 hypothetical protein [Yersinia enterocolitica]MCB5313434.1 hypothetical protein [Yersinia intermedia]